MQNSTVMFTFFIFVQKYSFRPNLVQKLKIFRLSLSIFSTGNTRYGLKFSAWNNSIMQNSVVVFTFSVLDHGFPFCANFVRKIKIVSLSWKLVTRLIQIHGIQWYVPFFSFSTKNILFWTNLVPKFKIVYLKWNFATR